MGTAILIVIVFILLASYGYSTWKAKQDRAGKRKGKNYPDLKTYLINERKYVFCEGRIDGNEEKYEFDTPPGTSSRVGISNVISYFTLMGCIVDENKGVIVVTRPDQQRSTLKVVVTAYDLGISAHCIISMERII